MTDVEYQTMFALWCLVKSPLMLGTDMTKITRQVLKQINKEVTPKK